MAVDQPSYNFVTLIEQSALESTAKAILKEASIQRVEISNSEQKWRIYLSLSDYMDRKNLLKLATVMQSSLPQVSLVEFYPSFPKWEGDVTEGIKFYWPQVRCLLERSPIIKGWLNEISVKIEEHTLELMVNNKLGQAILESKGTVGLINRIYLEEIGLPIRTVITVSDNGEDDEDDWGQYQRQEELRILKEEKINIPVAKPTTIPDKPEPIPVDDNGVVKGKLIKHEPRLMNSIVEEEKGVVVLGQIFKLEVTELKNGKKVVTFGLTDLTDSLLCKFFEDDKDSIMAKGVLKNGTCVKVRGHVQVDRYANDELTMMVTDICLAELPTRQDTAEEKRVELHAHTKMSSMDGIVSTGDLVKTAIRWGHKAIAITDHGVVQAYPEADEVGRGKIKIIYGLEGYLVDDQVELVTRADDSQLKDNTYVVFDLETTGLSPLSSEIIEIAAVRCSATGILEEFSTFVKPQASIPAEVIKLTGISDDMVQDSPSLEAVLPKFKEFIGDSVLVAHNADFDMGFINTAMADLLQHEVKNPVIDTVGLARVLYPEIKNHRLNTIAKLLGVSLKNHHRAIDDALATANIFLRMLREFQEQEVFTLNQLQAQSSKINFRQLSPHHIILLTKNPTGLKNLYKLVTKSHLEYYHRVPRIPKSELIMHREGLLLGSACEAGQLIQAYLQGASEQRLLDIASFYDYLEVQPVGNNAFMLKNGQAKSQEDLCNINRKVIELGHKLNIPVVATGDVHFLNPNDEAYRRVLMASKGFSDADDQAPLFLRTTEEMLAEFSYLDPDTAEAVVITNPNALAETIEDVLPMPDDFFPPQIDGAEQQISDMTYATAISIYGEPLPEIVQKRIDKELNSIINNGFSVLYLIAHKLVKKSNEDGYLVGSRGSVGSSFVANMTGITEVNSLPPHYVCPNCKHAEFIEDGSYGSGADMPDRDCPKCGTRYKKDGHDIPFETFLGFKGDKVPDIDLNFSGDNQPAAMAFTEELFGKGFVFRAGTIGTVAEKTAFGYAKKYFEERGQNRRTAEIERIVQGCTGVKRTTGQHPGGVMVVPRDMDVHDFTPLQHPADDAKSGTITTHFDYHSISGRIVKLDILGHDDPTVIRMLEDLTGVNAKTIPLDDTKVLSLFSSTEALGVTPEQIRSNTGTYGIPEFGTKFVRQMLEDTKPKSFSECVRISGFSHGTDVWLNNAQDFIKTGTCTLSEAISTRDDIMVYLIYAGLEPSLAFKIMESVRKGKGVPPEWVETMKANNVPDWYIESCRRIKYMFPKAHAVAYVMMAFRIAWFKVYYPEAFYATYFTVRADEFDADLICEGYDACLNKIAEIEAKGNEASPKEKNMVTVLEMALEMYARGVKLRRVSLKESHATRFTITELGLLPPFGALEGVGVTAAKNMMEAREQQEFSSIEDLRLRARLSKTVIEIMEKHHCLRGLPQTAQMELF